MENASDSECIAAQCSDSTVSEVILVEATEEGSAGRKAVAEAAALAGSSQAEGPREADLVSDSRNRDCGGNVATAVSPSGAGPV